MNLNTLKPLILSGQATESQMSTIGYDAVRAIKTHGENVNLRALTPAEDYKVHQTGERRYRFAMSNERVDQGGDILKASGWDLSVFKRNPIALFMHAMDQPIGTWRDVKKNVTVAGVPGMVGDLQFADKGISSAIDVWEGLVATEVIRGASVGFRFQETKEIRSPEQRQEIGLGPFGVFGLKMLLFETSLVTIPMNSDAIGAALDHLLSKGMATKDGCKLAMSKWNPTSRDFDRIVPELCAHFHVLGALVKDLESAPSEVTNTIPIPLEESSTTNTFPFTVGAAPMSSRMAEIDSRIDRLESLTNAMAEVGQNHAAIIESLAGCVEGLAACRSVSGSGDANAEGAQESPDDEGDDLTEFSKSLDELESALQPRRRTDGRHEERAGATA